MKEPKKKICPKCGSRLVHRQGTSKKGNDYDFWGCSNYPECEHIWSSEDEEQPSPTQDNEVLEAIKTVMEAIKITNNNVTKTFDLLKKLKDDTETNNEGTEQTEGLGEL